MDRDRVLWGFRAATCGMENAEARWLKRAQSGLTDEQLVEALRYEIGAMGGRSSAEGWVEYSRDGLQIWIAETSLSRYSTPPTLRGNATVRMAREVYGIGDPGAVQMGLFA